MSVKGNELQQNINIEEQVIIIKQYFIILVFYEWVSDCCLMPTQTGSQSFAAMLFSTVTS
jgi:hypothetical protein